MKLIIDIDEDRYDKNYLLVKSGMGDDVHRAVANGTPIPDNATNGDVIKAMTNFIGVQDEEDTIKISTNWWNAPYQKGGKDEVN